MIDPRPLQRGQVCCTAKMPWLMRTWPAPLQASQVTGVCPLGRARSAAFGAFLHGLEIDLGRGAEDRLLEVEGEFIAQVGAAIDGVPAGPASAAEDVAEHVAEHVAECVGRAESLARAARGVEPRGAVLIVRRPLLGVGQDLVGFLRFLEALFGLLVVGIAVRVIFHRQAPVCLGDGILGGVSGHAQHLVEIALRHGAPTCASAGRPDVTRRPVNRRTRVPGLSAASAPCP